MTFATNGETEPDIQFNNQTTALEREVTRLAEWFDVYYLLYVSYHGS